MRTCHPRTLGGVVETVLVRIATFDAAEGVFDLGTKFQYSTHIFRVSCIKEDCVQYLNPRQRCQNLWGKLGLKICQKLICFLIKRRIFCGFFSEPFWREHIARIIALKQKAFVEIKSCRQRAITTATIKLFVCIIGFDGRNSPFKRLHISNFKNRGKGSYGICELSSNCFQRTNILVTGIFGIQFAVCLWEMG